MATFAALARFDAQSTAILQRYKDDMRDLLSYDGSGGYPPHLTLACYEMDDCMELLRWVEEFAAGCPKVPLRFSSLGVYCRGGGNVDTEVIYAVPTAPVALTQFYYGFHERLDEHCGSLGWQYSMAYGQPEFHSTIVICKAKEFYRAMDSLRVRFQPFDATIEAIEIFEIPMKLIKRFALIDQE